MSVHRHREWSRLVGLPLSVIMETSATRTITPRNCPCTIVPCMGCSCGSKIGRSTSGKACKARRRCYLWIPTQSHQTLSPVAAQAHKALVSCCSSKGCMHVVLQSHLQSMHPKHRTMSAHPDSDKHCKSNDHKNKMYIEDNCQYASWVC